MCFSGQRFSSAVFIDQVRPSGKIALPNDDPDNWLNIFEALGKMSSIHLLHGCLAIRHMCVQRKEGPIPK